MKKNYSQNFAAFYFFLLLIIGISEGNAQVIKTFKERTSSYSPAKTIYKIKGNFTMLGNTNLTLQNYAEGRTNGTNAMVYVDKDNDSQTHNSSSATLDLLTDNGTKLTNCYNIVYAGLYWTGRVSDANISPISFDVTKNGVTKTLDKGKILFKGPNDSTYDEFTATDIYFPTNADNNMFTAYAEVTDYVRTNGIGEYFAANIAATEGSNGGAIGKYAGWGLVVIYENSNMKNRDITVFDGHAFVRNQVTANYTIPVSGFNSVTSGPVGIKIGVMAGEGDVNYDGDYFQIEKLNSNTYQSLSRAGNSTNNFFNSSINTGGNARNPNLVNNSGIDISMFDLPNSAKDIIGNNQTSTTFRYGSTVDTYTIFSIVMAVDAYVPEIEGVLTATTINGSPSGSAPYTVLPAQELGYKIQIKNRGSEAIQNSKIVIPIPYNATFVPGSLGKTVNFVPVPIPNKLTYEPTIGANGSIVWNLGTLPLPSDPNAVLAELTFRLKSTENCALLQNSNCSNVIQVNGLLSGKGVNSTVTVADKPLILGYTTSGSCNGNAISAPLETTINATNYINTSCQSTSPTIAFTFCNGATTIPVTDVTGSFPTGSTFYNAYPVVAGTTTQYTINNPFPATTGTATYYAIPPGASSGCYFQFTINVESITTKPTVISPLNYCVGDTAIALTAVPSKPEYTLYYYETATSTGQQSLIPSTATAGQFTYYVAEGKTNACIGPKKEIVVNINSKPTLSITNPLPICAPATSLDLTASSITAGSSTGLTYTYWTDLAATIPYSDYTTAIPGTYYIKGTNASDCYEVKPVVVTKSTVVLTEAVNSHLNVNCFGQSTGTLSVENAIGGVAPYTYSWKKDGNTFNGTSQALTNLSAGSYEVTATDTNGCTGTATIIISEPNTALTCSIVQNKAVSANGLSNGEATSTATGGNGNYNYLWDNNETTATAISLSAGLHTVTITDAKGCTTTCDITITQPGALSCSITQDSAVKCYGENNAIATVTVVGGNGDYTYLWDNNETTAQAVALNAGLHTVTITDKLGYTTSCSITITQPSKALHASTNQVNVSCGGANTGSASVHVSGGTGSYTYSWNTNPVQTTSTANNLMAGTYSVIVTDANLCTITKSVTILDGDSVKPIIDLPVQTTTIDCADELVFRKAGATDDSGIVASITYVDSVIQGDCPNSYTITRTWTATDDCGNVSLPASQTIIVKDLKAPNWTTSPNDLNIAIRCDDPAALVAAQNQAPIATDNCGIVTYTKTSGPFVPNATCSHTGTYTNTWIATDECGNISKTFTQEISIEDNTAPKWSTPTYDLDITLQCNDAAGLLNAQNQAPIAIDECGTLTYTKTSGQFVADANCANAGTYTNTWIATDSCSNSSIPFTQVISIEDFTAPIWSTSANALDVTLQCNDAAGLSNAQNQAPIATDNCGTVTYTKTSGQFVAAVNCAKAGTYTNTWIAKDECGNTSTTFTQVIAIEDTTAPIWSTAANALDITLQCTDAAALTTAQNQAPVATECGTIIYTKTSGSFVVSANCANAGTYTNTWIAKDECGNISTTFTQIIAIEDTTAPTWSTAVNTLDITLQCTDSAALLTAQNQAPTATDNCSTVTYTKTSGLFVASANCTNAGTYTNTWIAKDECGNTSTTFTQVISIKDTIAPTWITQTGSLNKTIECSDQQTLASAQALFPIASDLCDTDVSNIIKITGQFVASATCSNEGTYTNTWTVKDDCGNVSDIFTQVITIQDTINPIFTGVLPVDITVSCDAVPEAAILETSDNCNSNLPIVFSETKSDIKNQCGTEYTLTRKWTTSDCGENTASHTQIITVRDTTPPTGTAPADVANLQSITDIPVGNPQDITDAADNCAGNVTITVSDSNNGASGCDGNAFILTRTYTLTDCAGNKTDLVQTFTVDNKVSVSGIATNVSCSGGNDGSILVTNSTGSTVIIRNQNNDVVGNTNLPAGTYTLTATSVVGTNQSCIATATVTITQPSYTTKISGHIINKDTNAPIANVPVTLVPQGTTQGAILIRITNADGLYSFSGVTAGSYLVQVQDANLNSAQQLYPIDSSLFFTTIEECKIQVHDFFYEKSNLPVLGDYVWYDTNGNAIQDEWYDANNDGVVTKNIPDSEGAFDYSQWEWIDLNGDGSYTGPENVGELNAGGFGNALSSNIIIDGPNGYHEEMIIGIQGYWRNRPETANPYGQYTIKLVRDANLDAVAASLGATGLVKVLPSVAAKKITSKTSKSQLHTVCQTTSNSSYIVNVTAQDLVHLDIDFGVNCKQYQDIIANDDSAGPIVGVNQTTPNVLNVLLNDTLEGVVVTPADVIITTVTPNDFLQLNPDGSVDVLPNAPVGTLTLVYQICEADQTSNCDTATVTITIVAPEMTVTATAICVNDVPYIDYVVTPLNFTPANGVTIAWAGSDNNVVTTMNNLPLSGRVLWPGAVVDANGKGIDWPGWVFENNKWIEGADGFEKLRPTANLTLSVNPSQTITVNYPPADPYCIARPTFTIVANDDTAGPINGISGGTNVINVYTNDTLNNSAVNPSDVTLTTVTPDPKGALTLNPDGSVNVAPNTPAGTYTLTYQICENADSGNCDQAIVTVTVVAPAIVANDDTYNNIGCNTFGLVGNVLSNDLLNQVPATLQLVNFTLINENNNAGKTDPNITIDASGNVTVGSLTPAGTYTYTYQICEKLNTANCDTATVTITVLPVGTTTISSEACTDDSTLIDLFALLPANTPTTGAWTDINSSNALQGNILNAFGLPLGNYAFEYKIADQNCPRSILLNMEVNDDCKVLACGNIVVHNAFSPNGDGFNDVFEIDNIDDTLCYPGNTVEIYNRWGILVFETTNYNNTTNAFDGTSRGRTTVKQSDGLPTGTYFYILNYQSVDGNNVIQNNKKDGYLYLSK